MDYKQIHDKIISRAELRPKYRIPGVYERHHIIPTSMGGINNKSNYVNLTYREHYLIHWLLVKIYPNNRKLICAFWFMCNGANKKRPNTSNRMYEEARTLYSNLNKGRVPPNKGIPNSLDIRLKISRKIKENNFPSVWIGRFHSEESKIKQSESAKKRKINIENESKRRLKIKEGNKGKSKPKGFKENLSINRMGGLNPTAKKIFQYTLDGTLIKVWDCQNDVLKFYKISSNKFYRILKKEIEFNEYLWYNYVHHDIQ